VAAGELPPGLTLQTPAFETDEPIDVGYQLAGTATTDGTYTFTMKLVRFIEHQAHAPGHAALLIEERGVLVPG